MSDGGENVLSDDDASVDCDGRGVLERSVGVLDEAREAGRW